MKKFSNFIIDLFTSIFELAIKLNKNINQELAKQNLLTR